jgi:hypothetical protein
MSLIYFHEVQDDWFAARDPGAGPDVYRDVYRAYGRIIKAHPARPLVTLEKNLMWYWQHYNGRFGPNRGDWRVYVEPDDPADLVSWDTYAFPGMPMDRGRYATPDEFFRYAKEVWNERGLPWAVGEIGTTVQDGRTFLGAKPGGPTRFANWDRDGAKFVRWVSEITAAASNPASISDHYVGVPPARFVKWWAATDAAGNDLSLEQNPAAVAVYRERMRNARL